jgi:uncharacterized membrane-anchored protein YhcB (DUF1043 family)
MNGIEQSTLWITGAVMLLLGIGAGLLLARRLLPGAQRARELEKELESTRAEHKAYRQQVTAHFEKTGDLFQEMAKGYRTVYDHLAHGAHDLCGEGMQTPRLDLPDTQLLTQAAGNPKPEARAEPTMGQEPNDKDTSEQAAPAANPAAAPSTPETQPETRPEAQPEATQTQELETTPTDVTPPVDQEGTKAKSGTSEKVAGPESDKERPVVH